MFLDHDDVFNTDAEFSVFVVARLIRDAHSLVELTLTVFTNTLRALVHVEEATNSVACAVLVVKTGSPEVFTCKNVHVSSRNTGVSGPHKSLQIKNTEQDASVSFFLESCRFLLSSEMCGSCHIGGTIEVLCARVAKVDFVVVKRERLCGGRGIMDDGAVRANRRNSFK